MSWILLMVFLIGGERVLVTHDTGERDQRKCQDIGWALEKQAKERGVHVQWECLQERKS
jgi:hypothetical protein